MTQVITMERLCGGVVQRPPEGAPILVLRLTRPKTAFQRFLDILKKEAEGSDELSEELRIDCIKIFDLVQHGEGPEEKRHLQVKELIHKIRERTLRNPIDFTTFQEVVMEGGVAYERRRYAELKARWGGVSPVDGHLMDEAPKPHVFANALIALIDDLYKECDGGAYEGYRRELNAKTSEELGLDGMYAAAYRDLLKECELSKLLQSEMKISELLHRQKSLKRLVKDLERKEEARVRLTERIEELQRVISSNERLIALNRQSATDRVAAAKKRHTVVLAEKKCEIEAEGKLSTVLVEAQRSRMEALEKQHLAEIVSIQKEDERASRHSAQEIEGLRRVLLCALSEQNEIEQFQTAGRATLERLALEDKQMKSSINELRSRVQENERRTREIAEDDDDGCSIM